MLLTSTSDIVRIVTDTATTTIDVHADWADITTTAFTPGRTNTAITGNTTTTVVASPAGSTQRQVKTLSIVNSHATLSQGVIVQHYDGATSVEVYSATLAAGESAYYDGKSWNRLSASGAVISGATARGVDVQIFTASGNWVKPTTFTPKFVRVVCIGGGGSGGGGASAANAAIKMGGAGGGGGAYIEKIFTADDLGANESVTVAQSVSGGNGGGAAGAVGSVGNTGNSSSFGTYITAYGGGGGRQGAITAAAGSGGGGGAGSTTGSNTGGNGGAGARGEVRVYTW